MADIFGAAASMGAAVINNEYAKSREEEARRQNYAYNEMAAQNADKRTRALYTDLYSPQAQMQQIMDAGLSPSVYYGNMSGMSGNGGAQGAGAAGISPNTYGIDPESAARIALMMSQKKKTDAETHTEITEQQIKDLEKSFKEIEFHMYNIDYNILTEYVQTESGRKSLYEFAEEYQNYDDFVKALRESGAADDIINTEQGQKGLREIFMASREFKHDIAVLSEETISANFEKAIVSELQKTDFAKLNAQAAVQQLQTAVETNELTEDQKGAWNRLLDKMGEKGSTGRDIALILAMIVDRALSKYHAKITIQQPKKK